MGIDMVFCSSTAWDYYTSSMLSTSINSITSRLLHLAKTASILNKDLKDIFPNFNVQRRSRFPASKYLIVYYFCPIITCVMYYF